MHYNVSITGRAEREALIAKAVAATTLPPFPFHEFRNNRYDLPVIRISLDVPIYRMQNFRTFTDQTERINRDGLPTDFFQAGQEVESVQQIQHALLAALAEKGVADSVAPVMDVLKRDKQREPLLMTSAGVMVNGNRRLAAMRELFADPDGGCEEFSHIDFAVLPGDATLADILEIEAGLQAKQETKLDYDWVGDAQLMSALMRLPTTTVTKRLNRGDKEIRNTIAALAEADLYLKEWVGAPGKYSLVRDDAEQLFKDIPKRLDGKDAALQQASRVIAWTLFDNRKKLTGRIYDYNVAFGKRAGEVLENLSEKLGISIEAPTSFGENDDEEFAVDFGDDDVAVNYDEIIDQLRDPDANPEIIDSLIEFAGSAVESERGLRSGQAALKAVTQAHAKLMAVDISRAAPDSRVAMKRQLEGIEQLAKLLLGKLQKHDGEKS